MQAREDREYHAILKTADIIVPDGIGVIIASKMKKTPLMERVPGFELMEDLLALGNENPISFYWPDPGLILLAMNPGAWAYAFRTRGFRSVKERTST